MASACPPGLPVFILLVLELVYAGFSSMMDLLFCIVSVICLVKALHVATLYPWFLRCLCLYWDVSGDNSNVSSESSLAHSFFCLCCQFPRLGLRNTIRPKHLVSISVQTACRKHASNRLLHVGIESLCRGDILCVSTQFIGHSLRFTSRTGILLFDIGKHLLAG